MKIQAVGFGKVKRSFERANKDMKAKAAKLIAGAGMRTATVAKQRLQPHKRDNAKTAADIAAVRQSINSAFDAAKLESMVYAGNVSGDHKAAYLEFGTGKYAAKYVGKLTPDWQALAMQFYVNGKGKLRQHPYLLPAYKQESKRLADKLTKLKIKM